MGHLAIIGCGAAGSALAVDIHLRGLGRPKVHDCDADVMAALARQGGVAFDGLLGRGLAPVEPCDPAACVDGASVIIVAATADRHGGIARSLAPLLRRDHIVLLYCGYVAGSFCFFNELDAAGAEIPTIVEAANTLHLCGTTAPGSVYVAAAKRWLQLTGLEAGAERRLLAEIGRAFPELEAGRDCLETGFINVNPIAHVPAAVCNHALLRPDADAVNRGLLHFDELLWPEVVAILEAFDRERSQLMRALGLRPISRAEFNARSYPAGSRLPGPPPRFGRKLLPRHIDEDVPLALVPFLSFAEAIGLDLPVSRALFQAISLMSGRDFTEHGRTVERIGIHWLSGYLADARSAVG